MPPTEEKPPPTLPPFARYASWLDGETLRINVLDSRLDTAAVAREVQRGLKMAALLGHRMAITDMQLVDSPGISLLFADPRFRSFLAANRGWLLLFSRPDVLDGDLQLQESAKRARAGLHRSQRAGWKSSPFLERTTEVRDFHRWCLERMGTFCRGQDLEDWAVRDGWLSPPDAAGRQSLGEQHRLGILHALAHFAYGPSDDTVEPGGVATNYFAILEEVLDNPELSVNTAFRLENLLRRIEKWMPSAGDRIFRSNLHTHVEADPELSDRQRRHAWRTAVFAWNCANARSIGAASASFGPIAGALRVPVYLQEPITELIAESRYLMRPPEGFSEEMNELLHGATYDFSLLEWDDIARIFGESERERAAFVAATSTATLTDESAVFRKLLGKLSDEVSRVRPGIPKAVDRLLTAAGLIPAFGEAKVPVVVAKSAFKTMRFLARRATRYKVMSTLNRFSSEERA